MEKNIRLVEYMKYTKANNYPVDCRGFETFLKQIEFYLDIDDADRVILIKDLPYWLDLDWQFIKTIDTAQDITSHESKFLKMLEFENMKRLSLSGALNPKIAQTFLSVDHGINEELVAIARAQDGDVEYTSDYIDAMKSLTKNISNEKVVN